MDPSGLPPPARRGRPVAAISAAIVVLVGAVLIGGGLLGRATPTASPTSSPTATGPATTGDSTPTDGASGPATPSGPPPTFPTTSVGYLVTPADLADRVARAARGEQPYAKAQAEVIADAEAALSADPHPAAALNIPGTEGPFVDDTASAYGLALAYATTGDVRFAQGAKTYILSWVGTTKSLINACPSDGSCQTSLIVARVVPGFVFAADLIRPAAVLTAGDQLALGTWLHDLILPELPTRSGNWGDAGDFSRAAITDFLGDSAGFAKALDEWKTRLDAVPADGHLPDEVRRGPDGMSYTQEALMYKVGVARLAELRGVDLWSYVGKQGASLKAAIDLLRTYWFDSGAWPYDGNVRVPSPGSMWEIAYQHYKDRNWRKVFADDRPFGTQGHSAIRWSTLTNGIPIP